MECLENTPNTTECLLRAILEAQSSGFNWDPLNFAFTAAIGVLALIVAAITVFQGLLSAGPGRIKAAQEAIGPFAKYTKMRFSWTEMRLRTRTKTPFIRSPWFLEENQDSSENISEDRNRVRAYPARWRSLLESTGCHIHESVELVDVDTDYLPSDIQAAPAWATVETVMQIAGMAGCNKFTMTPGSLYPEARGPHSQLRFREHPDLGAIAIFDNLIRERIYRTERRGYFKDVLGQNMPELTWSRNIRIYSTVIHTLESCSHSQCLAFCKLPLRDSYKIRIVTGFIGELPLSPRFLISSSDQYLDTMKHIGFQYEGAGVKIHFGDILQKIERLTKVITSPSWKANPQFLPFLNTLGGKKELFFQGDEASVFKFTIEYAMKYRYLLHEWPLLPEEEPIKHLKMGWSWLTPASKLRSNFPENPDLTESPFTGYFNQNSGQLDVKPLVILPDCDVILSDLADGKLESFGPLTRPKDMKIKLQLQLLEIDSWLHRHGDTLSICQIRILVMDTIAEMKNAAANENQSRNRSDESPPDNPVPLPETIITEPTTLVEKEQTNREGPRNPTIQAPQHNAASPPETSSTEPIPPEPPAQPSSNGSRSDLEDVQSEEDRVLKAKEEGMRALLVLRAAIWTAYMLTAGDLSFLYDKANGDIRNRVVQII